MEKETTLSLVKQRKAIFFYCHDGEFFFFFYMIIHKQISALRCKNVCFAHLSCSAHSTVKPLWCSSPCHPTTPTLTSCQDDKLTSPRKVNNKVVHPQTVTVTFRNTESQVVCIRNKVIGHFDTGDVSRCVEM